MSGADESERHLEGAEHELQRMRQRVAELEQEKAELLTIATDLNAKHSLARTPAGVPRRAPDAQTTILISGICRGQIGDSAHAPPDSVPESSD